METTTEKQDLVITRVFDLPVEKVWRAWTEPETCKKWWAPKDFTCPYCSINLITGGKYLSCMRSNDGKEYWSTGVYHEIIPFKKLVLSDSFSDEKGNIIPAKDLGMPGNWPLELMITVIFEEAEGKTKMVLRHEGLPPEIFEDCKIGWNQSFDKLEENIK